MQPEDDKRDQQKRELAATAAKETGITQEEALTLITLIGMDRGALLREARILKKSQPLTP